MRKIILMIGILITIHCNGQMKQVDKRLKILDFKKYANGYVFKGIDISQSDTIYFISIKDTLKSKNGFKRIQQGCIYSFRIADMDIINGIPSPVFPNGYSIKFGSVEIKRLHRNGNTINTTQYISLNTTGLYIKRN